MKCTSCGGALDGNMTFCPFCGVRADVDLQQVHFRDIGTDENMPCPDCMTPLGVIEFDTEPKTRIERCQKCLGMFFNPGELVFLLEASTNPLVWLDTQHLAQLAVDHEFNHEIVYLKCPVCAERMSHINFGGRSGVILDRCGTHGLWVQGGELRRLLEWWRAGGKLIFQQHEQEKLKRLRPPKPNKKQPTGFGDMSHLDGDNTSWAAAESILGSGGDLLPDAGGLFDAVGGILGSLFD